MREVSEESQDLVEQLVAWELIKGREDLDVKLVIRQIPLADLSILAANISEGDPFSAGSAVARLVLLELHYRTGHMADDWNLERKGQDLLLTIHPLAPVKFIKYDFLGAT
jgi:hypothetical protein